MKLKHYAMGLVVATSLLFTGCTEEPEEYGLQGSWGMDMEIELLGMDMTMTSTFENPNKLIVSTMINKITVDGTPVSGETLDLFLASEGIENPETKEGTWSTSGDTLTMEYGDEEPLVGIYEISGNTLKLTDIETEETQTLTRR